MMQVNNRTKGILFIITSAFCFSVMNMFVRLSGDIPSIQKSFFRNLIAFMVAALLMMKKKERFVMEKGNGKYMVLRATFGTIGILCNFYAVDHLVLSDASMLNKMSPFFAILFSFLLIREELTLMQGLLVCGAFLGSLLIIKPTFANMNLVPSLIGFLGGVGAGAAYTMVRILGQRGQKGSSIVLFFSGFSCLITVPYLLLHFHAMEPLQVLYLLGAGVAAAGGQFAVTAAYTHAPAREISVYDYSQIIFSAILGLMFFGQIPDGYSVLGYFVIIAMAVIMFFYNQNRDKKITEDKA